MNNHFLIKDLLEKLHYKKESISTEELKKLYKLLAEEESKNGSTWIKDIWEKSFAEAKASTFKEINYDLIYSKIEQTINLKKRRKHRIIQRIQQFAAIMLLPLLGLSSFLYIKSLNNNEVEVNQIDILGEQVYLTPKGLRSNITLADGTSIWLNASSKLTVKEGFGIKSRRVELEGEAFFDVTPNKDIPFFISTPYVDLNVIGTSFNLSAYPDNEFLETVLINGKVNLLSKKHSGTIVSEIQMKPDQLASFNKNNGKITVKDEIETDMYTSWIHGKLTFKDTPIKQMIQTLESWYNVEIIIKDKTLEHYRYTGTFDNRTIDQVMNYISLSSAICYKKEGDVIYINKK